MKNKIKLVLLFMICITNFLNAQSTWWHTSGQLRTGIPSGGFNGASANTGSLLFYNSSTANTLNIQSGATSTSYTLTLPIAQGASSTVLTNNGSGTLTWENAAGIGAWSLTGNSGTSASTNFIGTIDNVDWVVKTFNTERMRVLAGGNVGIGTTSPSSKFDVSGITNIGDGTDISPSAGSAGILRVRGNGFVGFITLDANAMYLGHNSSARRLDLMTNETTRLSITGGGNVGIGTTSPTKKLHVNGDSYFDGDVDITGTGWITGGTWTGSDQMFKTNIDSLQNALAVIRQLKPKTYYWDTLNFNGENKFSFPSEKQYGFIAQDIEQVLPELVKSTTKFAEFDTLGNVVQPALTYKGVNYIELIAILAKGIQELEFKNDNLQSKVNNQDSINVALQENNTVLQNQINNLVTNGDVVQNQLNQLLDKVNNCCNAPTRSMQIGSSEPLQQTDVKLSDVQSVVLEQNVPNPFAEQTTINYTLPDNTTKAQMLFYNSQGKLIQSTELTQKGSGQLNVFASDLSNGIYTYTLVVDGRIVDSKKMIRNK